MIAPADMRIRALIGRAALFALAAFGIAHRAAGATDGNALELAVKATFLYKFELYIAWPASAFASPTAPFHICIVGDASLGDMIDRVVNGQYYGQHPIEARRIADVSSGKGCQMIYLAGGSPQLSAAAGRAALTVTDDAANPEKGMINFRIVDGRVRFEIDNAAASRSGLGISSKLLAVATSVVPAP